MKHNSKRVHYKTCDIKLNGVLCPTATVKEFKTSYQLECVFCSCPSLPNNVDYDGYDHMYINLIHSHQWNGVQKVVRAIRYTDCACTKGKTLLRPMNETEYKRVGCKCSYNAYLERFTKVINEHNN